MIVQRQMLIFFVGPRVGDTSFSRQVLDAGHIPLNSDCLGTRVDLVRRFAERALVRCDAVLLSESSPLSEEIARSARWEGKPVYRHIDEL